MSFGKPMPLRANALRVALPRLRRYARLLTEDPARADDLVAMTLQRACQPTHKSALGRTREAVLLALLRAIYAEQFANPDDKLLGLPSDPGAADRTSRADPPKPSRASEPPGTQETLARLFRLPLEQREVLVLVAVERMSYDEVATLLAMPVATVLVRLARAREALRAGGLAKRTNPRAAG